MEKNVNLNDKEIKIGNDEKYTCKFSCGEFFSQPTSIDGHVVAVGIVVT